jgi:predicted glycoside hydrolase/deacetylase ChbG (UPF0249 family)
MNTSFTPLTLCADDYAQNPGIDTAVLTLLAQSRLSAVSCFSTAPRWRQQAAPALREHCGQADFGLHFNLTEGFSQLPAGNLQRLILRSLFMRMDPEPLRSMLHQQLSAFEAGFGQPPDFIDGHQHVHQLRGVRQVLLEVLSSRYPGLPIWVRNTLPADPQWRGKPLILQYLGGGALAADLRATRIPSNHGFAGVYGFDQPDYGACMRNWLSAARPGMLIMCHPGAEPYPNDPIAIQRVVEYLYLQSTEFGEMLEALKIRLTRLSQINL